MQNILKLTTIWSTNWLLVSTTASVSHQTQRFYSAIAMSSVEKATFAAGCFWGVQKMFDKHFKNKGLISSKVGYIGGQVSGPNYGQVCSGTTGHAEALEIDFDPSKVTYNTLVEFFYRMHDPTTKNYQGPDKGTQYRSAIFYHSDQQKLIAQEVTKAIQAQHFKGKTIATEIVPGGTFTDAETYHQKYLDANPNGYECPTHFLRW